MENNNGRKWTIAAFACVCVAIAGLTVAFANLSETLNISPAATVSGNVWKIEFDNLQKVIPEGSQATGNDTTSGVSVTATTITGIAIELNQPGDSISYTFDVVNKGTINAKINSITIPTISGTNCTGAVTSQQPLVDAALVCDNLEYTLKYSATDDLNPGVAPSSTNGALAKRVSDTIPTKRSMTLTITYGTGGTSVPTDDVTISGLAISIIYVQD